MAPKSSNNEGRVAVNESASTCTLWPAMPLGHSPEVDHALPLSRPETVALLPAV
jgi:hypothetical protein